MWADPSPIVSLASIASSIASSVAATLCGRPEDLFREHRNGYIPGEGMQTIDKFLCPRQELYSFTVYAPESRVMSEVKN